jgi:phytoene synthase
MDQPIMDLADQLAPLERFAVAYAPAAARAAWIGLFAFEQRLADTAKPGRDALMIQLRLAWWRDRMAQEAALWPRGEPLLAGLQVWDAERPRWARWSMAMRRATLARMAAPNSPKPGSRRSWRSRPLSGVSDPGPIRASGAMARSRSRRADAPAAPPHAPAGDPGRHGAPAGEGLPATGLRGFGAALRLGLTGR